MLRTIGDFFSGLVLSEWIKVSKRAHADITGIRSFLRLGDVSDGVFSLSYESDDGTIDVSVSTSNFKTAVQIFEHAFTLTKDNTVDEIAKAFEIAKLQHPGVNIRVRR